MRLPTERAESTEIVKGKSDYTRRRFRIRKDDLEKFGYTAGCPGCRAVNRGATAANHSEECRSRVAEELEKVGDERLARETERLFEYLEGDENKKGKRRQRRKHADCLVLRTSDSAGDCPEKQRRSSDGVRFRRQCAGDCKEKS